MSYWGLVEEAWRLTWRHRFTWVLGLLAGGAATGSFGNAGRSTGRAEVQDAPPAVAQALEGVTSWAAANVGLLVAIGAVALLIGLALLVASFVARGAVVRAAVDLETGHPTSLGAAWRVGRHLFWRYVRLTLLLAGAAIVLAAILAGLIAVILAGRANGVALMLALLIGAPAVLLLVPAAIAASIVVSYAERAIAVDDVGAIEALRHGWRTFQTHLGESALAWLVSVAVSIGMSIVAVIVMGTAFALLGGLGVVLWAAAGLTAPTVAYAVLALLALLALGALLAGIANTFLWNYWTLAYLRLHGAARGTT
jgi:hypothetical protein